MRRSKNVDIVIVLCTAVLLLLLLTACAPKSETPSLPDGMEPYFGNNVAKGEISGEEYLFILGDYEEEYDLQMLTVLTSVPRGMWAEEVMDYETYQRFCTKCDLTQKYDDPEKSYLVHCRYPASIDIKDARLADVDFQKNSDGSCIAELYMWAPYDLPGAAGYVVIIPTDESVTKVQLHSQPLYDPADYTALVDGTYYEPYPVPE